MRNIPILILSLIIMVGSAGAKVFKSKGAFYYNQPAKELAACYKFANAPVAGAEVSTLPVTGTPLNHNGMYYLPVVTNYLSGDVRQAYTTVYALDPATNAVKDSLLLKQEGVKLSFSNIIYADDLYLAGIRDSLLFLYKVDASLKIIKEIPTSYRFTYIAHVSVFEGMLRIAGATLDNDVVMYDIKTDTYLAERKRFLMKSFDHYDADGGNLWYFSADSTSITTAMIDLSRRDPNPVFKSFQLSIPVQNGYYMYSAKAAGQTVYISYSWPEFKKGFFSRLTSIDTADGSIRQKEFSLELSFDVTVQNGKTYITRNNLNKKKEELLLAELKADLSEASPLVKFFLSHSQIVRSLLPCGENQFFLSGFYEQKTGRKIEVRGDYAGKRIKLDETYRQAFLAVF